MEAKEKQKEFQVIECFNKNGECSKKIINAHSIQNNKILSKISDNGEVMYFNFDRIPEEIEFVKTGRKKATTFRGFCGYHDTKIFLPIEAKDYSLGDYEQEFLFCYRALAKEYSAQMSLANMFNYYLEKGFENPEEKAALIKNHSEKIKSISFMKNKFCDYKDMSNINLQKKRFWKVNTKKMVFSQEYPIAVSSMFYIERDVLGNVVNDLTKIPCDFAPLFLTIFPQNGNTYILFSYFNKDKNRYSFLDEQIINKSENIQKIILSNILALYVENIALSPILWSKIDKSLTQQFYDIYNFYFGYAAKPDILAPFNNLNIFLD